MTQRAADPHFPATRTSVWRKLTEGADWRWKFVVKPRVKRLLGITDTQWLRVVMNRNAENFVSSLDVPNLRVLEISATADRWSKFAFKTYRSVEYPEYDVCAGPLPDERFDLIILEQVLEHVRLPRNALHSVRTMLAPGGWFLVNTPFLLRVHAYPDDCSRWTEQGMELLLIECGFEKRNIRTGAWGNRACIKANFRRFPSWIPWWHSLRNEPLFPIVVWAFAQNAIDGID